MFLAGCLERWRLEHAVNIEICFLPVLAFLQERHRISTLWSSLSSDFEVSITQVSVARKSSSFRTTSPTPLTPSSAKAIWDFEGIYCTSRHLPHVKFPGLIHPGILGCAPSAEVRVSSSVHRKRLNDSTIRSSQHGTSEKASSSQQIS